MDSDYRRQIALTVAFAVGGGIIYGGPLLVLGALANDRLADFFFFRDTLHALNVFGEYPWWNPSYWAGFPSYYPQILYWPGRGVLFSLLAAMAWLLGRIGIIIPSYHALYIVYFAFLVPLSLNLALLALARQILRRRAAIYLAIVLAAFSPGVILSLSDLGTETAAYGFWFAAALLAFLRRPGRTRFLLLTLAAMALGLSLSYYDLFWNVFFVPAFAGLTLFTASGLAARARRASVAVPGTWWAAAAAAVVLCALPSLITYTHGDDILVAQTGGEQRYRYERLRPGNPMEIVAISTPGVGFEWPNYASPESSFEPRVLSRTSGYMSFGYMGIATLPLVLLGLAAGRGYWSTRLLILTALVASVILLASYSPLFSLVLALPGPLQAINHYSDYPMRMGLFAVFIIAAGLGLEWMLRTVQRRWLFAGLMAATAGLSVIWLVGLQGIGATRNFVFGLGLVFIVLHLLTATRLALARTPSHVRAATIAMLVLLGVDTATFAFAHLRLALPNGSGLVREPGPDIIGSAGGREEEMFLYLRGLDSRSLLRDAAERFQEPAVLSAPDGEASTGALARMDSYTYNSLALRVETPRDALLELEDAHFPFWRAWVGTAEVPVSRSARGMKEISVPAGAHDVRLQFAPPVLRATMAASYAAFAGALLLWLTLRRRERAA